MSNDLSNEVERLTAEVERLKRELGAYSDICDHYAVRLTELHAELDRWRSGALRQAS